MSALPPVYSFPPLYTRQPNSLTRRQQISTWIDIISQYCKTKKIWYMSVDGTVINDNELDSGSTDNDDSKKISKNLFNNEDIQRSIEIFHFSPSLSLNSRPHVPSLFFSIVLVPPLPFLLYLVLFSLSHFFCFWVFILYLTVYLTRNQFVKF